MPGAWNDDDRQRAEDGYDHAPPGASAAEELAHEIALAAALDRSRPSLSPDPQASARMRQRLLDAMAEQGLGRSAQPPRSAAPAPGPSELTAPLGSPIARTAPAADAGPLTEPVGRPVPAGAVPDLEPDAPAASVGRAAGEHTLSGADAGPGRPVGRTRAVKPERRSRRARHVLPADHPDQATSDSRPAAGRPGGRPSGRRRPSLRKRFGIVVTAVAALAVLAGVAATASRNALPGDALYGVKRVTESTGGMFTFGDQAEAARQLGLARTRVDELESLMGRGTPPDAATVTAAIDDFDRATSNGSRLMLAGDGTDSGSQLGDLRTWATAQSGRMEQLRTAMPPAAVPEADGSIALLDRVLTRTEALRARTGCAEPGSDSVDDLGPLPPTGGCAPQPGVPTESPAQAGSDESTGPSEQESSSGSSDPSTPTSSSNGAPDPGLAPVLPGDAASSQSGEPTLPSSPGTSSAPPPAPLLGPITLPPLLPGLDPVTIG